MTSVCTILCAIPEGKTTLERPKRRWNDDINVIEYGVRVWTGSTGSW